MTRTQTTRLRRRLAAVVSAGLLVALGAAGEATAATWNGFVVDAGCAACTAVVTANDTLETSIGGAPDTVDTAYGWRDVGDTTGRLWFRDVLRLPSGYTLVGDLILAQMLDGANRLVWQLSIAVDRKLVFYSPAGGLRSTAISLKTAVTIKTDGSEQLVEVSALRNDSVILRVDGVDRLTVTGLAGATTSGQRYLRAGIIRYAGTATNEPETAWHRAVDTSTTGWLGPPGGGGGPDTTPPAAPAGLTATAQGGGVALDWADNGEADLAGYHVYRAGRSSGPFTRLTASLATTSSYTDPGAPPGVTVYYRVTAVDASGNESGPASANALTGGNPVIAAAGDIACDPADAAFNGGAGTSTRCRQGAVSDLLAGASAVIPLGDTQYVCGGYQAYLQSYDPSWGRYKSWTRPVIGNHEYITSGSGATDCDTTGQAKGYFDYFNGVGNANGPAGERGKGYYSYDLGAWHVVVLNTECAAVSCAAGSAQEQWLRQDLAASQAACELALFHHPPFTSGRYKPGIAAVAPLFQALYDSGVDLLLTGHDHNYERFALQAPGGVADPQFGVRQILVGTGGHSFYVQSTPLANSQVRNASTFGVLKATLAPTSYTWQFVPAAGGTFTDSGTTACHGAPGGGGGGGTHTFTPVADTHVRESMPTSRFGDQDLWVDGAADPEYETFLRFDVTGLGGPVTSAKLRLWVYNSSVDGPRVAETTTTWAETITWNTRPAPTSPFGADAGAVSTGWMELDVTEFVTGNGAVGFVLAATSNDSVGMYSREDPNAPQLVVTTG